MGTGLQRALAHLAATRQERHRTLAQLVSIPSVSSDPRHAADVQRAARCLAEMLTRLGLQHVRLVRTGGGPIVLGEHRRGGRRPCLLVYGHYDVTAAGAPGAWASPPFSPTVRGRFMYGRGASDDKGPLVCHLAALRAWLRTTGGLPVDVVCVLDGEEEVGSPGLRAFLRRHGRELGATVAVVSDTRTLGPDRPTLITSLRGTLVCHLRVTGPRRDVHSGQYGGAIANPAEALSGLLASLHDARGRINVPGFYDCVRAVPAAERARLAHAGPSDHVLLAAAGVAAGFGERGWSAFERTTLRPSLTVARLAAGRRGTDAVVPAAAEATLSLRLVGDQDPADVAMRLRRTLAARTPPGVTLELSVGQGVPPWRMAPGASALRAAARALTQSFPVAPVALPSGGTIGVVSAVAELGLPVLLMGFARPDDGIHGPNERADLTLLDRGANAAARLLHELARPSAGARQATASAKAAA